MRAHSPMVALAVNCLWTGLAAAEDPAKASGSGASLPPPLVRLREVDPTILQDIRYATADNFTGAKVTGYNSPECILTEQTARALARVQADVRRSGLSLKVYDCYRPRRAVSAFMTWVGSAQSDATKRFHPLIDKRHLVQLGYIAARSSHSRGNTVDLTLVEEPEKSLEPFDRTKDYGPCTGPAEQRAPDSGIDMGTGYDCFDKRSNVGAAGLSEAQVKWRRTLANAMVKHGFHSYAKEWWHFSLPKGDAGKSFNVPIE